MTEATSAGVRLPAVDPHFLEAFLPREVRLVQRRLLGHPGGTPPGLPSNQLGLFLVRVIPTSGAHFPADEEGGLAVRTMLLDLLSNALRFSDVVGAIAPSELLGIARDLDGDQAFQIAQRILAHANELELLRATGLSARLAYVIYPLSLQPDLAPGDWHLLLDLARSLALGDTQPGSTVGKGILRADSSVPNVSEGDLVRLALRDLSSMTSAGLLRVQRIHLLPGS